MKGIQSKDTCPKCGKPFKFNYRKLAFICPKHLTEAKRFIVTIFYKGERIRRATDLDGKTLVTFADAHALKTQADKEIEARRFNPERWKSQLKIEYAFSTLIEKWYTTKQRLMEGDKRAPSYVPKLDTYIRLFFLPCYQDTDVREIFNLDKFDDMLPTFRTHDKRKKPLSLKYQSNLVEGLKSFFRWLRQKKYITELPSFPETIQIPKHEPITIDKATQIAILKCVPDMHKPIFTWLFHQGCRPGEVRALKWDCIRDDVVCYKRTFSADRIVEHTKTKKVRYNFIYPETSAVLPEKSHPNAFVFTHGVAIMRHYSEAYLNKIYNEALQKFNEENGSDLHVELYEATKHSFGTQKVNDEEVSLDLLQKWFGHTKRETTEIYAKLKVVDAFRKMNNVFPLRSKENKASTS